MNPDTASPTPPPPRTRNCHKCGKEFSAAGFTFPGVPGYSQERVIHVVHCDECEKKMQDEQERPPAKLKPKRPDLSRFFLTPDGDLIRRDLVDAIYRVKNIVHLKLSGGEVICWPQADSADAIEFRDGMVVAFTRPEERGLEAA